MRRTTQKLLALGTAATLGLAACGDDETTPAVSGQAVSVEDTATTMAEDPAAAAGEEAAAIGETDTAAVDATTDDPASTLRSQLTSLLQEDVLLAGAAIEAMIDADGDTDDPSVTAALAALDESSVALGDVIGTVAGQEDADAFLEVWQGHTEDFVAYAVGRIEEDDDAVQQSLAELEEFQQGTADFLDELTDGELLADELFGSFEMHVTTMTEAIDAMVAEDPEAFGLLLDAADHMEVLASDIASGVAAAHPDDFAGEVASVPSETRASLSGILQAHAYLSGIALEQVVEAGGAVEDPLVQASTTALDANSVDLANAIGAGAGNDERQELLDLWREHIDHFVTYAVGRTTGDQAAIDQALADLAAYQQAAGQFFERTTAGAIAAADVVTALEGHVATMTAAIDAFAAGDPAAYSQLRAAGQHLTTTAATLAAAIVQASEAEAAAEPDSGTTETTMAGEAGSTSGSGSTTDGGSTDAGSTTDSGATTDS